MKRRCLIGCALSLVPILTLVVGVVASAQDPATAATRSDDAGEPSGMKLHVTLPSSSYAPLYERVYETYGESRLGPDQWIPLGNGSSFFKYRAVRHGNELALEANRLVSQATLVYSVEYAKRRNGTLTKLAECGMRATDGQASHLTVQLQSSLSYQPDYSLASSTRVASVKPLGPCLLGPERVDASALMARIYQSRLESALPALDRSLREAASFKTKIARAWTTLQAPIPLDERGSFWLLLEPGQAITSSEPTSVNGALKTDIDVTATARVVAGPKPAVSPRPLPPLRLGQGPSGFHVPFTVDVSYEVANARLREALIGQEFGIGPGRLAIRRARVYPVGKLAGVDIEVDGLIAMSVKLRGLPTYDQATETIGLSQVEFEVAEKNALMNFADQLLHDAIREQLTHVLKIPLRESLEEMRREIQTALNRDFEAGTLHGELERLRVTGLAVGSRALSASFHTDGTLRYDLR